MTTTTSVNSSAEPETSSIGKILVVDDDRNLVELIKTRLLAANYQVEAAFDEEQARSQLQDDSFDLAIVDLRLTNSNGLTLMEEFHDMRPEMPVIILTGFGSIENAVDAMKKGAYSYLTKPFDARELLLQIGRALENRRLTVENRRLKDLLQDNYGFSNIITRSEKMRRVLETVARVAKTESTVYIHGQSGTGKELIAKALHLASPRKDKPFVAINCAALPETLLESELFGHEKGSFTGAVRSTKGLFSQAHEGTIFLDEIGDMPMSIQVKLLRVLEERVFYPIGSEKPVKVNVRVVVATHKDLVEEVKNGLFREDMFYRIHVIPIRLPPLKDRKEDIPYLVDHFLNRICSENKLPAKIISPAAMQRLMTYDWPGNVRQLENTIEYALVMTGGETIGAEFILPANPPGSQQTAAQPPARVPDASAPMKPLKDARADFEKAYLIELLERCDGKAAQAAEIAGKYRADFYDLLKKHGIRIQDYKAADAS
jgi:two-component system response regulator GlrR